MSKAGYKFTSSANLGKKDLNTVKDNERDLTKTQKKLEKHGYGVNNNKAGLGFTPNAPVKISSKAKNASVQHIRVSIIQDKEEPQPAPQTSVFDRMNRSKPRVSAPKLIGVMERLEEAKEPFRRRKMKPEVEKIDRLAEKDDVRSFIPSRMKHQAILEVNTVGSLKVNTEEEAQDVFHITIQEGEEDEILEEDIIAAPSQLEDGGQATVDDLKELNLGTSKEPKPIFLSALLSADEIEKYYQLLLEYKDVFAWTYKEMPGLDPIIDVHHLAAKIDKLIEADFIREDNFPLSIIEIMVDTTTSHEALSFMDGSSGYNQIRMALKDEELTAFRTPKGIYYYKVMPFGLKNAGATYQRAMRKIFNDMLHKNVECYVDDVVVKTKKS
ncbi:hypothetical protein ACFX19_040976 [Malus domestica]